MVKMRPFYRLLLSARWSRRLLQVSWSSRQRWTSTSQHVTAQTEQLGYGTPVSQEKSLCKGAVKASLQQCMAGSERSHQSHTTCPTVRNYCTKTQQKTENVSTSVVEMQKRRLEEYKELKKKENERLLWKIVTFVVIANAIIMYNLISSYNRNERRRSYRGFGDKVQD